MKDVDARHKAGHDEFFHDRQHQTARWIPGSRYARPGMTAKEYASDRLHSSSVMAGLDPAIHVLTSHRVTKTWMPGTRPGMTYPFELSAHVTMDSGFARFSERPE
jgi:hypothetical protein